MVFFDLSVKEDSEIKAYTKFRKFLLEEGFIMFQYSVYVKLTLNASMANLYKNKVRKNAPNTGFITVLQITEKQFSKMEYIYGNSESEVEDSLSRILYF